MATDFKSTQPKEYYRKFLEQEVRPDGRELGEIRVTTLNVGSITTADGSALVKLGNTTVLCGIKSELTAPKTEDGKKGFIVPNVELPPLCSAQFRPGPPPEQAQVASFFMDEFIKNSQCIKLEDLCVVEGKLAWILYCDLVCLDYDGNLLDACCLALVAALRNVRLPGVKQSEETGLAEVDLTNKSSISAASQPVATSFAVFDDHIVIADPTREEETLATSALTVVTLDDDKLCMVHKPGGSSLSETKMQECISRAESRGREVRQLIDETIHDVER